MPLGGSTHRDLRRLVLAAITVAIVVLAGIVAVVVWAPPTDVTRIPGKWIRFALVNGFLVFYELRAYWKLRKSLGFWGIFLGALGAYLACVGYFFYYGDGISLATFVLAGVAEATCFALVIYGVFGVGPSKVNLNL
jgi:hypothetical protein